MDLAAWLARKSLIRQLPLSGTEFDSDGKYLDNLKTLAAGRIAIVPRPLLVHN